MIGRMPAPLRARRHAFASARGGSIMPIEAKEDEFVLDVARRAPSSRAHSAAADGTRRRACAGRRRPGLRWRSGSPRGARRSAVSAPRPTSSCEQRASSTSGAPLVKASRRSSPFGVAYERCSSACARTRTEPRRRARSARPSASASSPALRAATISAPSVGSPWTVQRPSRSCSTALLARSATASARPTRSGARRRSPRRPSTRHFAVGSIARAGEIDAAAGA